MVSMISPFLTGLDSIAQGKECALEDTKTKNTVRNKNNVLRSQSTLWNLELLSGQREWVKPCAGGKNKYIKSTN